MNNETNKQKDDEVLAQLYKTGANETPPAKLNYEIIKYAADAHLNTESPIEGSSHFGGGWKVPLSMAACLVVVFGLLVQIDQGNQILEIPPIPELSKPADSMSDNRETESVEGIITPMEAEEESSTFSDDVKQSSTQDLLIEPLGTNADEDVLIEKHKKETNTQRIINSEIKSGKETYREAPQLEEQVIQKPQIKIAPVPELKPKQSSGVNQTHERIRNDAESTAASKMDRTQQRSMTAEPALESQQGNAELDTEAMESMPETFEDQYAPIPVGDWLLMIEKLIARKDYAEAARQLQKFKQAHPKVNVEDLDAKIP